RARRGRQAEFDVAPVQAGEPVRKQAAQDLERRPAHEGPGQALLVQAGEARLDARPEGAGPEPPLDLPDEAAESAPALRRGPPPRQTASAAEPPSRSPSSDPTPPHAVEPPERRSSTPPRRTWPAGAPATRSSARTPSTVLPTSIATRPWRRTIPPGFGAGNAWLLVIVNNERAASKQPLYPNAATVRPTMANVVTVPPGRARATRPVGTLRFVARVPAAC